MVISGPDLLARLAIFPENFIFHVNQFWRITIKGGKRNVPDLDDKEVQRLRDNSVYSIEQAQLIFTNAANP